MAQSQIITWLMQSRSQSMPAQKNQETLVIIQADQDVSHGSVVSMMDRTKKAGLKRLAIATSSMKKDFL